MVLRAHGAPLKVSYNMLVINLRQIMLSLKLTLTLLVKITSSVRCHSTSPYSDTNFINLPIWISWYILKYLFTTL